jgi:hypothetical protein
MAAGVIGGSLGAVGGTVGRVMGAEDQPPDYSASVNVEDGVWTWYTDPRAIITSGGLLITGAISSIGDVVVTSHDLETGEFAEFTLRKELQADDHDNPSFWERPDGRIVAWYGPHTGGVVVVGSTSYSNPLYLASEGRLWLFCRRSTADNSLVFSDDGAASWSSPVVFFDPDWGGEGLARPYAKYATDGENRWHIFISRGHPREIADGASDLYHCYYDAADGKLHRSDGTVIADMSDVLAGTPLTPDDLTLVHDASEEGGNAWPHSIVLGGDGKAPVAPATNSHHWARWDGEQWVKPAPLVTGLGAIMSQAGEPQYTGIAQADPRDPNVVWMGNFVADQWEIQRWRTADDGESWETLDVTEGSDVKNFRPFVPWGADHRLDVLWCRGTYTNWNAGYNTEVVASPARERVWPPHNRELPEISGTPEVGQTLSVSDGSWGGTPEITFAYQWLRDGDPIDGATLAEYALVEDDGGHNIACAVTASNPVGQTTVTAAFVFVPSAEFSPANISGLWGWWQPSGLASTAADAGIAQWDDSSGNGRHLTQETSGKRPTKKAAVLNGHDVARFSGAASPNNNVLSLGAAGPGMTDPSSLSIFAVVKSAATGAQTVVSTRSSSNGWVLRITSTLFAHITRTPNITDTLDNTGDWNIIELVRSSLGAKLGHNGTMPSSATTLSGYPPASTRFDVGGEANASASDPKDNPLNGDIAELIVYSAAVSDSDREDLEQYLIAKYALAWD